MPHKLNERDPVDINQAVVLTAAQMADLKTFLSDLHARNAAPLASPLDNAQFTEIRSLLQPIHEVAKMHLAQAHNAVGAPSSLGYPGGPTPAVAPRVRPDDFRAGPNPGGPGTPVIPNPISNSDLGRAEDAQRRPFKLDDNQQRLDPAWKIPPRSPVEQTADRAAYDAAVKNEAENQD